MASLPASFTVVYDTLSAVADRSDDPDAEPDIRPVTATVDFIYRVPPGWAFRCNDYDPRPTDLVLDTFQARLDEGRLRQLSGAINLKLIANTSLLEWPDDLYVDIKFSNVVFNRGTQVWRNFAIKCPTAGGVTVNLTTVSRFPYVPRDQYTAYFERHPIPTY